MAIINFNRADNEEQFDAQIALLEQAAQLSADPSDDSLVTDFRVQEYFTDENVITVLDTNPNDYVDIGDAFTQDYELAKDLNDAFLKKIPSFFLPLDDYLTGLDPKIPGAKYEEEIAKIIPNQPLDDPSFYSFHLVTAEGLYSTSFDYQGCGFRLEQVPNSTSVLISSTHLSDEGGLFNATINVGGNIERVFISGQVSDKLSIWLVNTEGQVFAAEIFAGDDITCSGKAVGNEDSIEATLKKNFESDIVKAEHWGDWSYNNPTDYSADGSYRLLAKELTREKLGAYLITLLKRQDLQIKPGVGVAMAQLAFLTESLSVESKQFVFDYWKSVVENSQLPFDMRSYWLNQLKIASPGSPTTWEAEFVFISDDSVSLEKKVPAISDNPESRTLAQLSTALLKMSANPDQFSHFREKKNRYDDDRTSYKILQITAVLLEHGSDRDRQIAFASLNLMGNNPDIAVEDRMACATSLSAHEKTEDAKKIWRSILEKEPSDRAKIFLGYNELQYSRTLAAEALYENGERTSLVKSTVMAHSNNADFAPIIYKEDGGEAVDAYYLRLVTADHRSDDLTILKKWFSSRPKDVVAVQLREYWSSPEFLESKYFNGRTDIKGTTQILYRQGLEDLAEIYLTSHGKVILNTAKNKDADAVTRFQHFELTGISIIETWRSLGKPEKALALSREMTRQQVDAIMSADLTDVDKDDINLKNDGYYYTGSQYTVALGWFLVDMVNTANSYSEILALCHKTSPIAVASMLLHSRTHNEYWRITESMFDKFEQNLRKTGISDLEDVAAALDEKFKKYSNRHKGGGVGVGL